MYIASFCIPVRNSDHALESPVECDELTREQQIVNDERKATTAVRSRSPALHSLSSASAPAAPESTDYQIRPTTQHNSAEDEDTASVKRFNLRKKFSISSGLDFSAAPAAAAQSDADAGEKEEEQDDDDAVTPRRFNFKKRFSLSSGLDFSSPPSADVGRHSTASSCALGGIDEESGMDEIEDHDDSLTTSSAADHSASASTLTDRSKPSRKKSILYQYTPIKMAPTATMFDLRPDLNVDSEIERELVRQSIDHPSTLVGWQIQLYNRDLSASQVMKL